MKLLYAKAIVAALDGDVGVDEVLVNAKRVMAQRGHTSVYPATMKEVLQLLELKEKSEAPRVHIAKESTEINKVVQELLATLQAPTDKVELIIDKTLVGGAKVTYQSHCIDATYKASLLKLYQNVTN